MHPCDAQLPHAMIAAASAAVSLKISCAERPPIVQQMPSSSIGIDPSTSRMYLPLFFVIESCSDFSA
jgi:hypothetical protein